MRASPVAGSRRETGRLSGADASDVHLASNRHTGQLSRACVGHDASDFLVRDTYVTACVWTHRVHRNIVVDRSGRGDLRRAAHESSASNARERCDQTCATGVARCRDGGTRRLTMNGPATRGIVILLAVVLNAAPWLDAGDPTPGFITTARAETTAAPPLFEEEFLNPDSTLPMSTVARICELPDGSLAATWYAGSREGASDVAIYLSTKPAADPRWSAPRAIVTRASATRDLNRYIKKVGNPLIFADSGGRLWLIYVTVSVGGWSGSSLNLTI